jgi:uncharacterized membrane protein YkoI
MSPRLFTLLLPLALALAVPPPAAHGDADDWAGRSRVWEDDDDSHDRARRASEGGEILTMSQILDRMRVQAPGRVLDTELEREHGRWVYQIKLLDPEGRLYEVEVDAHSGAIMRHGEDH